MVKTDHRLATSTCEIILQMKGPIDNLNDVVGAYQRFLALRFKRPRKGDRPGLLAVESLGRKPQCFLVWNKDRIGWMNWLCLHKGLFVQLSISYLVEEDQYCICCIVLMDPSYPWIWRISMEKGTFSWLHHTHLMGKIPSMGGTNPWISHHTHGYVEYPWNELHLLLVLSFYLLPRLLPRLLLLSISIKSLPLLVI